MAHPVRKRSVTAAFVLLAAVTGCTSSSPAAPYRPPARRPRSATARCPASASRARCAASTILNSPFTYDGPAGRYSSGKAGLPTYGKPGTDFPDATAGMVLRPAAAVTPRISSTRTPSTTCCPGCMSATSRRTKRRFRRRAVRRQPAASCPATTQRDEAIDSNYSDGNQPGVTIEYLTIEKYLAQGNGAAINQNSNTDWTLRYNTITLNAPGAGMIAGADNTLEHNCMTLNGQYGFQSSDVGSWGHDTLTGGPYNITVTNNEISYNDTCDFEGPLTNKAIGWSNYNAVPARYRNPTAARSRRTATRAASSLADRRRDHQGQLHPQQLGAGHLGGHGQREHDLYRQHDHGKRRRRDHRRDLLQFLDHE